MAMFPVDGCFFLPPLCGSVGVCYVIRGLRSAEGARFTHSGGLPLLRGFVAPLSGAVSTVAFRGLRTLRVLAHGYEKSRPAGGNAAARLIGSRRRHFLGRRRDAGRHTRGRRRDAGRHTRGRIKNRAITIKLHRDGSCFYKKNHSFQ